MAQHGLHFIENPPSNLKFRYLINRFLEMLFGYPSYGYGYAGSDLDYYLVYSPEDRNHINAKNKSLAFSCPQLLKYDFLEDFAIETNSENKHNLFIMKFTQSYINFCIMPESKLQYSCI